MNSNLLKLTDELIDAVEAAATKARILSIVTGDDEFDLVASMLEVALMAKAKGDIVDVMEAMCNVLDEKVQKRKGVSATKTLVNQLKTSAN